jgi:hypothetical protein
VSGSFRNFRCIATSVLLIDDIAELLLGLDGRDARPSIVRFRLRLPLS